MADTSSSSVGSAIFALAALLSISILVLLLLRHYLPLRTTPAYLLTPVFLALALPCSIILLVPIDLASATSSPPESTDDGPSRGVWLPEGVVLVTWRITYWLTFCLTWFILPVLGEYVDSGYRDTRSRVLDSLRSNARYQAIALGTGIAGLVYFILSNGFHVASIKGLLMALAYAWGLVLAIGLMGHGLVALPRRLFKNAGVGGRLRRLQARAPGIKDKLDDAVFELEELEGTVWQLKQRKYGAGRDLQEWIDELADSIPQPDSRSSAARASSSGAVPAVLTARYLADLTRKLKRAKHKKARFVDEWSNLCQQAQDAQTILDSAATKKLDFGRDRKSAWSRIIPLTPGMRYQLHTTIIPYCRQGLSVLFAAASIIILFSEIVKSFAPSISIIGLTTVHHLNSDGSKVGFAGQLIAALWLCYMDACCLYAISDVKIWGNRALVKRQTYGESACWYSLQVAKLTVPLSYNFITMLPTSVYQETQFYKFLGQLINLTPLGSGFSAFFPCFLLVPVLATLFNVYGRLGKVIGVGVLEDEDDGTTPGFGSGGWREGRALIEREQQSHGGSGGGASTVGLAASAPRGGSAEYERPQPFRVPTGNAAAAGGTSTPPLPQNNPQRFRDEDEGVRQARRQFGAITNNQQEDEDDGARHFYQDFAERVRNTLDTVEQPKWVSNFAFKTPKWLQEGQQQQSGQGQGGGSNGGGGGGLGKWFGGRADDGRVRL